MPVGDVIFGFKDWVDEDPVTHTSPTPIDAAAIEDLEQRFAAFVADYVESLYDDLPTIVLEREFPQIVPEADDVARILRAVAALPARGGTIAFDTRDYVLNVAAGQWAITIGPEKPVRLLGADVGRTGPNIGGTRFIRTANGGGLLQHQGTSFVARARGTVENIMLNGQGFNGPIYRSQRCNDMYWNNFTVAGSGDDVGWRMTQVFNSFMSNWKVTTCGNGTAKPAMVLDGFAEAQGGCDTVLSMNAQLEGNAGTPIRFTGSADAAARAGGAVPFNGARSGGCLFVNTKMEGGYTGSEHCPWIDFDDCANIRFSHLTLTTSGVTRDVPLISCVGIPNGTDANVLSDVSIWSNSSPTGPAYIVDWGATALQIRDWKVLASHPLTAICRALAGAPTGPGYLNIDAPVGSIYTTVPLLNDLRPGYTPALTYSLNSRAKISRAAAYNFVNNAWTKLPFDTVEVDRDLMWDAANVQLKCKTPGNYHVRGGMSIGSSGAGGRFVGVVVNGKLVATGQGVAAGAYASRLSVAADVELAANDTVQLWYFQDSGGVLPAVINLDIGAGGGVGANLNWLSVVRAP